MNIPNNMIHIWIGEKPAPVKWMNTWKELHKNWNYWVFDNTKLETEFFQTGDVIPYLVSKKNYVGAADVIRYELLYKYGGFIPPADSICHFNVDELFENETDEIAYIVYENEIIRPDMFCPVYASTPNHPFLKTLLDEISVMSRDDMKIPYTSVGNFLVSKHVYKKNRNDIIKFPSHYFVPNHFTGYRYNGSEKVYASQKWGSTLGIYEKGI
jgi:mannosyltransferase OCH1-like enzyme